MAKRSTYKKMASSVKKGSQIGCQESEEGRQEGDAGQEKQEGQKGQKGEEALNNPAFSERPLTAMSGALFI
jgi:hypothetical protein